MEKLTYNIPALKWLSMADEPLMAAESLPDIDDDDDDTDEAVKRGFFDESDEMVNAPQVHSIWDVD